jgi:hypothetical protein
MFVSVSVIGQRAIGLRVQTIVKDSGQILELMEKIKAIDGIRLAVGVKLWTHRKIKCLSQVYIIDQL